MSIEKETIVIVDDEEMVLTSLKSFLQLETEYNVVTFTAACDALEYIRANSVDLVMSDYLMPSMNGIAFLARVRDVKPELPRIILTGYADKENAIKAINEVGLYHYLEKPWDNNDILLVLRNGLERNKLLKKLQEKIEEISKAHTELLGLQTEIVKAFV